jgi:hypothetical protein
MSTDFLAAEREHGSQARILHKDGGASMKAFRDLVQAAGVDGAFEPQAEGADSPGDCNCHSL